MAHTDLKTRRIYGCKKGTLAYLHEQGHLTYNGTEQGNHNGFNQYFFTWITALFLVIRLFTGSWFNYIVICPAILSVWYYVYEEAWCWHYAFKNKKK